MDEEFDMRTGTVEEYSRVLHMKEGILERSLCTSPKGRQARIHIRRLVSFKYKNIMAQEYAVTPVNFEGAVKMISRLEGNVENHTRKTNPIVDYYSSEESLRPIPSAEKRIFFIMKEPRRPAVLLRPAEASHLTECAWEDLQTFAEAGELDAQLTIEWTGKPGETRTLEKSSATPRSEYGKTRIGALCACTSWRRLHRKASRNLQIFRNDT